MALNSEVHPNVFPIDEEDVEEEISFFMEEMRKLEEERRKLWEDERKWKEEERKDFGWQVMQWKPTVDQINKMNWFPVCHKWYSIGESLGISKGLMEEIIHKTGLLFGIYHNNLCDTLCIKAMLIKWLNEDQGTGSSERTWITIAKAVKDVGLGEVVFEFLEEVVKKYEYPYALGMRYYIQTALYGIPTLQELKETIVHHLGEEWRSVGDYLGISPKVKEEIDSKFGSVPTQCSEAMFSKWLNHEEGTGHKERTWGTVLTALEDAGRGGLVISVLDKLTVKDKKEEALKKAPNIKEIKVLVIPRVARMWCAIGRFLGIIKAILTAIESEARKKVLLKQSCEMFQLWLDGREGTGDEDRSWLVILRVLVDIGRSDIIFEIQEHFDLKTKDIARALSMLCDDTQSSSDDIIPVLTTSTPIPTTSQGLADTASLVSPPLTNNVGQASLHDCTEVDEEVEEDKGCCSKSLSESSGSEVYTCLKGLDKRGRFPNNQPARSRIRQKWKKLNGLSNKSGLDKKRKCLGTFDLRGKSKRRRKKNRRFLSEKSGHSREHHPDQLGFSGQKRSPTSGDLEESDLEVTASSEFPAKKNQSKLSKSKQNNKISYNNVPVEFVIKKLTRKKLRDAVKKMLNGQRIRDLCDDWELIDETCRDIILGLLEKGNKVEAADQLIDYFKDTHTGEELLIFTDFLKEEAGDGGRNQQLLNLAESIEEAVYSASPEDQ